MYQKHSQSEKKTSLPKFMSLEHVILIAFSLLERENKAQTISNIIIKVNSPQMKELVGHDHISSGSIYGTLARLKGRKLLQKILIEDDGKEELGYVLTAAGKHTLNCIKTRTEEAIFALNAATA